MRRAVIRDAAQRRRSRYIAFFQLPFLPERKLRAQRYRPLRAMLARTSRPGTFTDADLARYAEAAAVPGALTAMLAWYRAALRRPPPRPPTLRVAPPVLLLWGEQDVALGVELVAPSAALCDRVEVVRLPGAGHWVQHEEPEQVSALLLDFLAGNPVRSPGSGT
jgi:pimeloyl-ACP methyl ester carboxylesterase